MDVGVDGGGGDVKLNVVSVTVEVESMAADDVTEGEDVKDEEERTKHRTLGNTLQQGGDEGGAVVDVDELLTVGEVGLEPGESGAGDVNGGSEAGQEDGVVDCVKCCGEVQENEDGESAGVRGKE